MVNCGLNFRGLFESEISIWRRYLAANLSLTKIKLISGLGFSETDYQKLNTRSIFDSLIKINYGPGHKPIYLEHIWDGIESSRNFNVRRACPTCWQHGYHTSLFELNWILKCPIHGAVITAACPECRKPWPKFLEVPKTKCLLCGVRFTEHRDYKGQLGPEIFHPIEKLYTFIFSRRNCGILVSKEICPIITKCVKVDDPRFPSLKFHLFPSDIEPLLSKCGVKVDRPESFTILNEYTFPFDNLFRRMKFSRQKDIEWKAKLCALASIRKLVNTKMKCTHNFVLYNLRSFTFSDFASVKDAAPCPICLAFSYWYHFISNISVAQCQETFSLLNSIGVSEMPYATPIPYEKLVVGSAVYDLPEKCALLLYVSELLNFFGNILKRICSTLVGSAAFDSSAISPPESGYVPKQFAFVYHLCGSNSGDICEKHGWCFDRRDYLHLCSSPDDTLSVDDIPSVRSANGNCAYFYKTLRDAKFQMLDESGTVGIGLTDEQLLRFKHGEDYVFASKSLALIVVNAQTDS